MLSMLCENLLHPDVEVQRQAMIGVIDAVADRDQNIREGAAKSFATYLEESDSQLAIVKLLIELGLRHLKWQTRLHTLLALQHIDIGKVTVLQNLLEEGIGPCLHDTQELVIQAARQTLTHWETKNLTREAPVHETVAVAEKRELVYGCVAVDVVERLDSPNWQTRSFALEEFHQYLTSVPLPLPDSVKNSVHDVLEKLSGVLKDNNFKITLTTLYVIGDLIELWRGCVIPVIGAVLPGLIDKLGDNKIVIRQTSMKVFYKIFQQAVSLRKVDVPLKRVDTSDLSAYVPRLLQSICNALSERARTELVSVIIMATHVLHQSRCPYDHKMVAQALMDVARDTLDPASPFAIEALGSLRAKLGPTKIPEIQELLSDRLTKIAQWGWPIVTSEGLVEYLFLSSVPEKCSKAAISETEWSALKQLPEDTAEQRPCTAVHSVVSSASDSHSRLTTSTSSSTLYRRHKGSGASSSSSDTCRRSSLSSSSKVRDKAVRVNFADEEVKNVNSKPLFPASTSRDLNGWMHPCLDGNLDQEVPYVPSGMQRPATRQINSRKGSKDGQFWEQFADASSKEEKDPCDEKYGSADFTISEDSVSPPSRKHPTYLSEVGSRGQGCGLAQMPEKISPDRGRMFHAIAPTYDIADKLRLLKTSSRASIRSNCQAPRPESTDFIHRIGVDQHARESLHSAPLQGKRAGPRIRGGMSPTATHPQYTTSDNLQPFKKFLEPDIKDIFNRLEDSDWQEQFNALDGLRRLAKFHPNEFCRTDSKGGSSERFHQALPYIIKLCDSPRSSVSKNAIICLHDLYSLLPSRCIEASVDLAMPMLLRKSVDTNGFVCDEALQCLRQMSTHISVQKLLPAMLTHQQAAKSTAARSKGLLFFCWILLRIGDINDVLRYRDAPRLFNLVFMSLENASGEVRQVARLVVQCLCNISTATEGLSDLIRTTVSSQAFTKMQQCALQPRMKVPLW